MNRYVVVIMSLFMLASCGDKEVVQLIPGPMGPQGPQGEQGIPGIDGLNGHSLVSQFVQATWCECDGAGGSRLDMYIDLDDSLSVSESDLYAASTVLCNGHNGLNGHNGSQGSQGPQGAAGATGPQGATGSQGLPGPTGPAGPQGPQGIQGSPGASASIVAYTSSSCTLIAGTSYYVKPNGSSGNSKLYTSSSCSSSSAVAEIGDGDSYWLSASKLAVDYDSLGIKVISFN